MAELDPATHANTLPQDKDRIAFAIPIIPLGRFVMM